MEDNKHYKNVIKFFAGVPNIESAIDEWSIWERLYFSLNLKDTYAVEFKNAREFRNPLKNESE